MLKKPKQTVSLSEWMDRWGVVERDLCLEAGVSQAAVWRAKRAGRVVGATLPSLETAYRIYVVTDGEVKVHSYFNADALQAIHGEERT